MDDIDASAARTLTTWRLDHVEAEAMIGWVEVLRDDNRIHVDPHAAQALGYGLRTVNPGPANLAYVLNMLVEACPGTYPNKIEAHFLGNVFSDDAVEVTGEQHVDGRCHASLRVTGIEEPVLKVEVVMTPIKA